jgi:hypothetical protein
MPLGQTPKPTSMTQSISLTLFAQYYLLSPQIQQFPDFANTLANDTDGHETSKPCHLPSGQDSLSFRVLVAYLWDAQNPRPVPSILFFFSLM